MLPSAVVNNNTLCRDIPMEAFWNRMLSTQQSVSGFRFDSDSLCSVRYRYYQHLYEKPTHWFQVFILWSTSAIIVFGGKLTDHYLFCKYAAMKNRRPNFAKLGGRRIKSGKLSSIFRPVWSLPTFICLLRNVSALYISTLVWYLIGR